VNATGPVTVATDVNGPSQPGAESTEKTFGDLSVTEGQFDSLAPENVAPLVVYLASDAAAPITGDSGT